MGQEMVYEISAHENVTLCSLLGLERRKGSKLILLFKGLKGRASIPCDNLQPPNRCSRNQHSMVFHVPYSRTDIYKFSFFPDTIREENALPASVISSADSSEDPVARFTSLVRSRY